MPQPTMGNTTARLGLFVLLATLAWPGGGTVVAQQTAGQPQANVTQADTLDRAAQRMADDMTKYLIADPEAGKQLIVESFRGPNNTVCARLTQLLQKYLGEKQFKIVTGGAYTVTGRVSMNDALKTAQINIQLLNRNGNQVHSMAYTVGNVQDNITLLSPTFDAAAGGTAPVTTEEAVKAEVVESVQSPKVFIASTIIKATPESPYGVELLAFDPQKKGYFPSPVQRDNGLAQCDLPISQVFAIRVVNESDDIVGVHITIDGINIFEFSDSAVDRQRGKLIVFPNKGNPLGGLIKGWHKDDQRSYLFEVRNYGESAAARLGITENIGTITVTFYKMIKGTKGDPNKGVAVGPETEMRYTRVQADFGDILGAVSVQYSRPSAPPDLPPESVPK
jgi:hypothetical protein